MYIKLWHIHDAQISMNHENKQRKSIELHTKCNVRLRHLLRIEHQAPDFDALSLRSTSRTSLIQERSMRRQPRLVRIRIETFDQRHLIRPLLRQIIPLVTIPVLDAKRRPLVVVVDVTRRDEVFFGVEGMIVGDGEGIMSDGVLNGAPDVDEADAGLEQAVGVGA